MMNEPEIDVGGTRESLKGEDLETRVQRLEDAIAALQGDTRLANLPYGTLKDARSHLALRSLSGSYGYYLGGIIGVAHTTSDAALAADRLHAIPFYMPDVPNVVIEIGIRVTGAAAGNYRLGIYDDGGEAQLYPHKLLLDAGVVSASSTGEKGITIKQEFSRGLKWLAIVGSLVTPAIRKIATGSWGLLGTAHAGGISYNHYYKAFSYAALPDPFPAGATYGYGEIPCISLQFG